MSEPRTETPLDLRSGLDEVWFPRQEVIVNVGLNDVMTAVVLVLVILHFFGVGG